MVALPGCLPCIVIYVPLYEHNASASGRDYIEKRYKFLRYLPIQGMPTLQSCSGFSPYFVLLISLTVVLLMSRLYLPKYDPPVPLCRTEVLGAHQ